jgi:hypothetical protein
MQMTTNFKKPNTAFVSSNGVTVRSKEQFLKKNDQMEFDRKADPIMNVVKRKRADIAI